MTTTPVYHRDTCRLCGGNDLDLVLPLTPVPIVDEYINAEHLKIVQDSYPIDVYLCQSCGHSQLLDVVNPKILYSDYIYLTTSSLGLVDHFASHAEEVTRSVKLNEGSLVVDIGSNDGTLLKFFKKKGLRVLGVDPAENIAKKATDEGIETVAGFFTSQMAQDIREAHGPASLVTVNNLYANIDDLVDLTQGIHDLLAPNGVFVFESFYLPDMVRNMVFDFVYHEHLNCFTVTPLQAFFRRMSMDLIDVQPIPTKGGSIRGMVQLEDGPRGISPAVSEYVHREKTSGVTSQGFFRSFNADIQRVKSKLGELLSNLDTAGNKIAGYGASASTTPLIYHFDLGGYLDFIADDNPAKQNLFSPGLHIPVLSSEALYQRRPDYVVILAWRYVEPIVNKHQEFLGRGGHFIVPLPEVRVI